MDACHGNSFAAQVKGCGGYNAILMVMTIRDKATPEFCSMIQSYRDLFGEDMYKRMAVVVTGVDSPFAKAEYDEHSCQQTLEQTFLELTSCNIPVIPIGHGNFKDARRQLCAFIPHTQHEPQRIISPLDKLKADVAATQVQVNAALSKLKQIQTLVTQTKAERQSIESKLRSIV